MEGEEEDSTDDSVVIEIPVSVQTPVRAPVNGACGHPADIFHLRNIGNFLIVSYAFSSALYFI